MRRPGKAASAALAMGTTFWLWSCRSKADFDHNDPQAVRRAVVEDVGALERAGIVVELVDTTGRVRVLVRDLTPANTEMLQRRYGPLIDAEPAR